MPAEPEAPPAPPPAQELSKTPTLLETLASTMDLSDAPQIRGKSLPPIVEDPDPKKEEKKPAPKEEAQDELPAPGEEQKPKKEEEEAQLQKDSAAIADKLFKKRAPKESKPAGDKTGTETAEEKTAPKAGEEKEKKPEEKPKPATRRAAPAKEVDEAAITERAASAAASAATRAVSDAMARGTQKPPPEKLEPFDKLTTDEKKQFVVYKELEALDPARYKGVTDKYLKSLDEISDYVKTWGKENPGVKFNADDEAHNDFFQRVEPEVDEDDWVDAKANLRARDIAAKAIAPVNERMQQMEQARARTALEPLVQQKQLESVHHLLEFFDPEVAEAIRKPDGLKELQEKDPITGQILNNTAAELGALSAEIVRLHDPVGGVAYSASNAAHVEIANFLMGEEARISKLAPQDKERDGKMFMGRAQYQQLPEDQKARYWYLTPDDLIYLMAQKYAKRAKNLRDARIEEFNKTADRLGYKKIDAPNQAPKPDPAKAKEAAKPKENTPSPEATSRASVKTTPGTPTTTTNDTASAIVGKLFGHLRSS